MRPIFSSLRLCLLVTVAAAVVATPVRAAKTERAVDDVAQKFVGSRTVGLGIAIAQGDTILVEKGYGFADAENKVEVTPSTVFRLGSITKQFTAVAIVQLVDDGKISLDDPITRILTDYPEPSKPITIRNLLQHTSGIPNFTNLPSYVSNMPKDVTHAELIGRFSELPLEFDPGAQHRYSNSGYYLLGMIIERASGETYATYVDKHLFKPAGMDQSEYETDATARAQGYRRNKVEFPVAGPLSMTQPFAAGALVSTAGDLVRWQRALVNGKLEPADAFARITSDTVEAGLEGGRYGYGIGVRDLDGRRMILHGGGINGFSTLLAYFPESDHTIAILANTEGFYTAGLLQQLVRALMPEED